uniref:Uncharacterized protein n=1 Tax=Arundo donax TaxID=35708 RepID=A0A0A9DI93_ARUDO
MRTRCEQELIQALYRMGFADAMAASSSSPQSEAAITR